jgi:hypothetical protein
LCKHEDESIYKAVKRMIEEDDLRMHYKEVGIQRAKDFSVKNAIKKFDQLVQ